MQTSVQTESASVYTSLLYDFHALKNKSAECRQNEFEMPMRTRTRVRGDYFNAVFDNYIYKFRVICFVNSKKIANFEAKHINNTIKLNIP